MTTARVLGKPLDLPGLAIPRLANSQAVGARRKLVQQHHGRRPETRMQETRPFGSQGEGAAHPSPYPYHRFEHREMKPKMRTFWNLTPREAMRLQEKLRDRVVLEDDFAPIRYVAGADLAFDPTTDLAFAGVIVYRFPEMEEVERRCARRTLRFPYVPGLLSFRESPVLLAAFGQLQTEPDLILIDGHGRAHPRLFGIACHIGVLFDKPVIGCAKSLLVGEYREPERKKGATTPLVFRGERVGVVVRTRDNVNPIFVTQGHRVSLKSAIELVSRCLDGFRIPKPTREADHYVRELRQTFQARGKRRNRQREKRSKAAST